MFAGFPNQFLLLTMLWVTENALVFQVMFVQIFHVACTLHFLVSDF